MSWPERKKRDDALQHFGLAIEPHNDGVIASESQILSLNFSFRLFLCFSAAVEQEKLLSFSRQQATHWTGFAIIESFGGRELKATSEKNLFPEAFRSALIRDAAVFKNWGINKLIFLGGQSIK